jgi:excisionase family DNA binding protein
MSRAPFPVQLDWEDSPLGGAGRPIEPLLSIDDLAGILNCSRPTIERMRAAGRLPRADLHVGRRSPRWKPETIRRWIETGGRA